MVTKKFLKFSYYGKLRYISYDACCYEDIVKSVMERYEIPDIYEKGIRLSNSKGDVFTKDTFEAYVQLYPKSQTVFKVRLDYDELIWSTEYVPSKLYEPEDFETSFTYSYSYAEEDKNNSLEEDDYAFQSSVVDDKQFLSFSFPTITAIEEQMEPVAKRTRRQSAAAK